MENSCVGSSSISQCALPQGFFKGGQCSMSCYDLIVRVFLGSVGPLFKSCVLLEFCVLIPRFYRYGLSFYETRSKQNGNGLAAR